MSTVNIIGTIGQDFTAKDMIAFLEHANDPIIEVNIASGGGSVFDGFMIYDLLVQCKKQINTNIVGLAGSAAGIIFMAGDERKMTVGGMMMTHKSSVMIDGNADQLREKLQTLEAIDERMKAVIRSKTELDDQQIEELFKGDNFMGVDKAIEYGLATGIADTNTESIAACLELVENTNQKKEPVIMADEIKAEVEKDEKSLLAHIKAFFVKDEPKAMDEKEEEANSEEEEEEAKAMDEDKEDEKMKAMEEEIKSLKEKLAEAEAKAESDSKKEKEQAVVKAGLVFDAMTDDKITMHEAKNLIAKPVADVEEALKEVEANATGRGKTEEPKEEPKANKYEEYCALSGNDKTSFFAKHKDEIIEDMKKEK